MGSIYTTLGLWTELINTDVLVKINICHDWEDRKIIHIRKRIVWSWIVKAVMILPQNNPMDNGSVRVHVMQL